MTVDCCYFFCWLQQFRTKDKLSSSSPSCFSCPQVSLRYFKVAWQKFQLTEIFLLFSFSTFHQLIFQKSALEFSNFFKPSWTTLMKPWWNLLIVDDLYSGHLSKRDTFLRNRWNDDQTFITKPLCSGHFIEETSFLGPNSHYSLELNFL